MKSAMKSRAKGQIAMEFFIYSGVFLVAVLAAYFSIFFIQSAEVSSKESLYVKWFGERFATHANTAMAGQGGFNYTMEFDPLILGKPYTLQLKPASRTGNGFVFITWSASNFTYLYPIGNTSLVNGDYRCISTYSSGQSSYYQISPNARVLNFYNDGEKVILSQFGRCKK